MVDSISLLVVDDHFLIRDGIKSILSKQEEIKVIGEAGNALEAMQLLETTSFEVILMDIQMPGMNGIDATKEILKRHPGQKIIALSMNKDHGYISKMLQAGAQGYVLKDADQAELMNAIKTVSAGKTFFSSRVTNIMMESLLPKKSSGADREDVPLEELTTREIEVLKFVAEELTNQQIADKLFISIRTVDTHRRNLMQKLGVKNTAGLVRYATKHGLIE